MRVDHTILIADDDKDDLEMLHEALKENASPHRIEFAYNGEEALEKLEELKKQDELPCLIILDVNMPKLNGKETLQNIRATEVTKEIPVIIFSTASARHEKGFYTSYNAQYFEKPFDYRGLADTVKTFLSICQHGRESMGEKGFVVG
jgi:CheY-like chemotaxis protein